MADSKTAADSKAAADSKTAADSKAAAPTLYRSAFENYVAPGDDKVVSWAEANALVKSIGGWRVYARESQQSAPANAVPPAGRGPAPHQTH